MKKIVLTCLAASILLASTAGAVKTYGNYKKNEFSELLLEDVEAKAWIQYVEIFLTALAIGIQIYQLSQDDSDQSKFKAEEINVYPTTEIIDGKVQPVTYHTIKCSRGGTLDECIAMDPHRIGTACNSHSTP